MKISILTIILIVFASSLFARSQYKVIGNDVIVDLEGIGVKSNLLKIELWSENMIRVTSTKNDKFNYYTGCIGERNNNEINFKVAYAQSNIEITTKKLLVNIQEDGMIRLLSRDGKKLLVESDRTYTPSLIDTNKVQIAQSFYLNRNEDIYGFGQKDLENIYSLRNQSFDIIQDNSSIASPLFFSEKGFALIWDNYSATKFDDKPGGLKISSEFADEISYFIIYGPEWQTIMSEIRNQTGKAKLLPYWAFGYHLSPESYKNKEDIEKAILQYQSLNIPVENNFVSNQLFTEEKQLTLEAKNNEYANVWAYKNLKDKYIAANQSPTNERVVIPTHTNLVGIQKYSTFTKSGEITSSWESLKCQVSAGITSNLTGQPYWSTSIGGIKSFSPDNELMTRWFQFAAFTPFFQSPSISSSEWNITMTNNDFLNSISKAIKLRYQLLPYIYSNAMLCISQNNSIMRSLLFDYQGETRLNNIDQQYLFGQSLMICPVITKGAKQIKVVFPSTNNWYDFWTGKLYEGGSDINVNVSIDHIPIFVKQGSIIPLIQNTDSVNAPISIRIYAGADAEFILYEDEKDGLGYANNQSSTILFEYSEKNKLLTIGSKEGQFPGMPTEYNFKVILVSETDGIGNTASENTIDATYRGKRIKVKLE